MLIPLTGTQIRQKFLDFYAAKGHQVLPSASLIPEDPTVLLTIAGMLPFKPVFLGQRAAEFPRVTTSQKCIRTNDIENVGRTARHHTFFEMLGNFSFGDYFKSDAIAWAWELSTQIYGLPPERIVPSVFESDDEAFAIWRDQIGIPVHRIQRMGIKDNFWAAGPTGPCGPCSELYYDFYPEQGDHAIDLEDDSRFIEFYNLVFMESNRDSDGNLTPLTHQNIDTGLGLERMAQILQQAPNNYETDLIFPIIQTVVKIAGCDYAAAETAQISFKVIGDHIRAIVHMIADGITASNLGRGYILRRLIRRVVRHGRILGIKGSFITQVTETAIALSETAYPQVRERQDTIVAELAREEAQFLTTLDRGEKLLAEILAQQPRQISGADAFTLYDTHGFPLELTQEIAAEQGLTVDVQGFEAEMAKQRDRSRDAHTTIDLTVQSTLDRLAEHIHPTEFLGYTQATSPVEVVALLIDGKTVERAETGTQVQIALDQTPFYAESGGQVGDHGYLLSDTVRIQIEDVQKESDIFIHYGQVEQGTVYSGEHLTAQIDRICRRRAQAHHTATHLLQAALKHLIDPSISQAGSLVAFDRLRFDFNCSRGLTAEDLQHLEDMINRWIAEAHAAETSVMSLADAKARGAISMFGEKYGEQVRVMDVSGVSMELCGGTHVNNTAEIGLFKIVSEIGIAAGIRRIEAVAGPAVLEYVNVRDRVVRELSDQFKSKPEELPKRIMNLQKELKIIQKQLETLKTELAMAKSTQLLGQVETINGFQILVATLEGVDSEALKTTAQQLLQRLGEGAVVLGAVPQIDKVSLVAAFSPGVNKRGLQAGTFIGTISKRCGGGGGGRPELAQAGVRDPGQLKMILAEAQAQLHFALEKKVS